MPERVRFRLNDDEDTVEVFVCTNAKWHKSCVNSINATKLQRVESVVETDELNSSEPAQLLDHCSACMTACLQVFLLNSPRVLYTFLLFCDKPAQVNDELHAVATENVNARVRHYTHVLLDEHLLAKLSAGDP
jgi:hypothetical protein